jgi:hypothetical protein
MNIPRFTAEASLYRTSNQYNSSAGGSFLSTGNTTITPQGCGWIKGGICGFFIAGGAVVCTASCLASPALGGLPCYLCWAGWLGGSYGYCKDCIPGWMRALIDLFESGGGGGGVGGGGGGQPNPPPIGCGFNEKCCAHDEEGNCIECWPKTAPCPQPIP